MDTLFILSRSFLIRFASEVWNYVNVVDNLSNLAFKNPKEVKKLKHRIFTDS